MDSHLDVQVKQSLQSSLHNFFHSLQGDGSTLQSFASTLSAFQNTIRTHRHKLQVETLVAVQGFATVIDSITSSVLELELESEKVRDETIADISGILGGKLSNSAVREGLQSKSSKDEAVSRFPSYIKPSYDWLLSNLHHPYPPKDVKKEIARKSKCSVKDIDSWFIDARKRIGWNTLRRQRFSNKQESIVAAATRFFKPPLEHLQESFASQSDPHDQYHAEFTAMENAARSLYPARFVDISATSPRNAPSPRSVGADNAEKKSRRSFSPIIITSSKAFPETHSTSPNRYHSHSYPTPEASTASPSPPASDALSLIMDEVVTSSKRPRSPIESLDEITGIYGTSHLLPRKRIRSGSRGTTDLIDLTLANDMPPSPAPTIQTPETSESNVDAEVVPDLSLVSTVTVPPTSFGKRKRRLSDGDNRRPTKRPHHPQVGPRIQAVSDPFPSSKPCFGDSIDDWFGGSSSTELELGNAIPVTSSLKMPELDGNVALDIHCYNYDTPYYGADFVPSPQDSESNGRSSNTALSVADYESTTVPCSSQGNSDLFSSSDLPLAFNFNIQPAIATISPEIPFDPVDQILGFETSLQSQDPSNFNWMPFPIGKAIDIFEDSASYTPEFFSPDFETSMHRNLIQTEDQDAKRLRLQHLRDELKLLESEIGS